MIEHGYYYLSNAEEEVLFDTQANVVENTVVTFDHPIYPDSLTVEEGGDLTISSRGTNYAIVSGSGILKGVPYVHTTKRLTADNEEALTEKIVTIEEATLVTAANSENVLARLSAYYFHATTVQNSIIANGESTGKRYSFENAFHEPTSAFLVKKSHAIIQCIGFQCFHAFCFRAFILARTTSTTAGRAETTTIATMSSSRLCCTNGRSPKK